MHRGGGDLATGSYRCIQVEVILPVHTYSYRCIKVEVILPVPTASYSCIQVELIDLASAYS